MKINQTSKWCVIPGSLKVAGTVAAACSLLAGAPAMAEIAVSGQSDTILRMGQSVENKNLYPAYEYLRLSAVNAEKDGSSISLHIGGWGRADLADKSAQDKSTNADLQYGYISYRGAKNNFRIDAGRQFISEGVAAQRVDALYVRSDLAAGFGASAYAGAPVNTEPANLYADTFIMGGRATHSNYKYYTLGVSALRSFDDNGIVYREEEGLDVWVHPTKQVDITGKSAYNSVTEGWMEHAYAVSYVPREDLRVGVDYSYISYQDYFYRVTTSALLLSDPTGKGNVDRREKVIVFGGNIDYMPVKNLTLVADYKNYNYEIAKSANYYGAKATCSLPDSYVVGVSFHRMDGNTDKLNFLEYRLFASKKISNLVLSVDFIDLNYDSSVNGVDNTFAFSGGASYAFNEKVRLGANFDFSKNPNFDNEVKGLVKLTYAFDTKHTAERGPKSEK